MGEASIPRPSQKQQLLICTALQRHRAGSACFCREGPGCCVPWQRHSLSKMLCDRVQLQPHTHTSHLASVPTAPRQIPATCVRHRWFRPFLLLSSAAVLHLAPCPCGTVPALPARAPSPFPPSSSMDLFSAFPLLPCFRAPPSVLTLWLASQTPCSFSRILR